MEYQGSPKGWFTPGQEVAGLRIERFLGQGAFSTVYLARDALIDRVVALKVLHPSSADLRRTIADEEVLNEARIVGRLKSPHIVTLYRVHPPGAEGVWMFEMEYLEGGSLEGLLEGDHRLPWGQARPLLLSVAEGLRDAHRAGIVHGDVKAANVLLGLDGTARLADFGLARLLGDAPLADRGSGSPRGTPYYMAPEVLVGESGEAASDIWSFGVLAYRTVAGHFPFPTDDFRVLFHAITSTAPRPLGPDVPPRLRDLIQACLAKRPTDRPAGAAALVEAIAAAGRRTAPTQAAVDAASATLIGRQKEIEKIEDLLEQDERVLVTGPAGSGRTALLEHLAARGHVRGETWLSVGVPPAGGLLVPLLENIRACLGPDPAAVATEARFGPGATLLREVLTEGIQAHRAQASWVVPSLMRVLCDSGATVLAIDDVDRLNDEDVALLARLHDVPCRVLFARREEASGTPAAPLAPALGGEEAYRRVPLGPLPDEAVFSLLEANTPARDVDPRVASRIVGLAGGNPLFALELLNHLQAVEAVTVADGVLVPGERWEDATLPHRLQDVSAQRLAVLEPRDRDLLDVAAVDGVLFDGGAVAAVSGQPLLDVLRRLQHVYRAHGIVLPHEHGYRFAHPVLHEAVYEHVAPELRRALHLQLAEHLEARQDKDPVDPERIGEHWARAGRPERARAHLIRAMGQAARREELGHAIALARKAGIDPQHLDATVVHDHLDDLLGLAHAYHQTGAKEEIAALYAQLRAHVAGDEHRAARVLAHAAWTRYAVLGLEDAELDGLRRLAASDELTSARAQARRALGRHLVELGEYAEGEGYLREAVDDWARLGEEIECGAPLLLLGMAARKTGRASDALRLLAESAESSRRTGNRLIASMCDVNSLLTHYEQGRLEGLETGLERAIHQFELIDAKHQALHTACILVSVRHALGDAEGAVALQEAVLRKAAPMQYLPGLTMAYPNLARWHLASGNFPRAAELRRDWGAFHGRTVAGEPLCEQTIFDARYAALLGREDEARELAQRAVDAVIGLSGERARVKQVAAMAESAYYAVPATELARLVPILASAELDQDTILSVARALLDSARALHARNSDPDRLRSAAAALRRVATGESRATRLCTAGWLAAEAAHRAGDDREAAEEANRALATSVALQNVWLQMHLLRLLARIHPGDVYEDRRQALIHHVARNVPEGDERERFVRYWSEA